MKTLFENSAMRIYMNPTNEPFILNKKTGVTLRFGLDRFGTHVTFDNARVTPTSIGGLPAFSFTTGIVKQQLPLDEQLDRDFQDRHSDFHSNSLWE